MMRAYVHGLSKAPHGLPMWAMWKDSAPIQPEVLDPNFGSLMRLGSASDGHTPDPCHAIIRVGTVMDCVAQRSTGKAPYEVAFVDWWTSQVPTRLARRLAEFDEVWVRTANGQRAIQDAFTAIQAKTTVRRVPLPSAYLGLDKVKPASRGNAGESVLVAVGEWQCWDDVQSAFSAFALAEMSARLVLVCPNTPFVTKEQLLSFCAEQNLPVPTVSVIREYPTRWDKLCGILDMADGFIDSSMYFSQHPLASLVSALGLQSISAKKRITVPENNAPYLPPQEVFCTDAVLLAEKLVEHLNYGVQAAHVRKLDSIEEIASVMQDWDAERAPAPPAVVPANQNVIPPPSMLVIIPFKDRDVSTLEVVIRAVVPQLGPMDDLIVSDQGSTDACFAEVVDVCTRFGVSLASDDVPTGTFWNISRARNVGLRESIETDWVMSLDADIVLPPGFFAALKQAIVLDPDQGYSPLIDESLDVLPRWQRIESQGKGRIGSGISALPRKLVEQERGWDELFLGYGSEDIDLLLRLRNKYQFNSVAWECPAGRPIHFAHASVQYKEAYGKRNLLMVQPRMRGKGSVEVNLSGWGEHGVLVLLNGKEAE